MDSINIQIPKFTVTDEDRYLVHSAGTNDFGDPIKTAGEACRERYILILLQSLADAGIEVKDGKVVSGWISVEESLPPLDADNCCMDESEYDRYSDPVMVFDEDDAAIAVACYDGEKKEWADARNGGVMLGVTLWMPLPAPPTDSTKEVDHD
jgi:hypothetical protein